MGKGAAALTKHQKTGRHVFVSAAAQNQPTIRLQMAEQNHQRKALIPHVLKIALAQFGYDAALRHFCSYFARDQKETNTIPRDLPDSIATASSLYLESSQEV